MEDSTLTPLQRKHLKSLAHHLDPIVFVGKEGLTDKVLNSLSQAFSTRELLKVQLVEGGDSDKRALAAKIAADSGAHLVQLIGFKTVLYRPNPKLKKRIVLP